jgi:hypothetical protein
MFATLEELRTADMDWLQSLQVLAANWSIPITRRKLLLRNQRESLINTI